MKKWQIIVPVAILCLALVVAAAALSFSIGKNMALKRSATLPPTVTQPFPAVKTSTPTAIPTKTPTPPPTGTPTPTPTFTPTPTPTPRVIITEVKSLGRLETTKYMLSTVIDLKREPANLWEELFGADSLLLIAEGEVVAGIDMTQIARQDIIIHGDQVTITLPPPEILYTKIDNERTHVYERTTGLFRKPDKTLEGEARQLAEQSMLTRAIEGEILEQAEANARMQIDAFLRALGFTDIVIIVRSE